MSIRKKDWLDARVDHYWSMAVHGIWVDCMGLVAMTTVIGLSVQNGAPVPWHTIIYISFAIILGNAMWALGGCFWAFIRFLRNLIWSP